MWSTAREVAAGDVVIIWLTRDLIQPVVVTPGKDFNSKYGNYRHADFVGVPYGSKVASRTGKGFLHILRPTPELWTTALPHRTQILYLADIALIVSSLNISRGSRVIEAGTGSASFSHSIARTIGSSGHLYSYEFHEVRAQKAQEEFERHGMTNVVSLEHRNVCRDGFTVVDEVDAVFLDLPAPWEAVDHAKKALRKDRTTRICCFSPCMEQVLRTVSVLNDAGFTEITMYETLLRPIEVSTIHSLQPVTEISERLKKAEQKREEKRLRQIAANKAASAVKRKRDAASDQDSGMDDPIGGSKRVKTDDDGNGETMPLQVDASTSVSSESIKIEEVEILTAAVDQEQSPRTSPPSPGPPPKTVVSKALPEVRGHTSYLTFACLIPQPEIGASETVEDLLEVQEQCLSIQQD